MKTTVLIVDDKPTLREAFRQALSPTYQIRQAATSSAAKAALEDGEVDLVLLDLHLLPGGRDRGGFEILKWIQHELGRPVGVIMCTIADDIETVVEAIKLGADDFLSKNCGDEELLARVQKTVAKVRLQRSRVVAERQSQEETDRLVGESPALKRILAQVDKLADKDETVLILGEAGSGKELIARRLHDNGWRQKQQQPFVALNCAGFPEALAASELFGHERGAFTSAERRQIGKLELAEQGTLFLDEVDCMPLSLQPQFLRALETKVFDRLGGNHSVKLRARIVAAAKTSLPAAVAADKFRADLFDRLNVIRFELPPLRERPDDIPLLAHYFLKKLSRKNGLQIEKIEEAAMRALLAYRWPGNVRELRHEFERMLALADAGSACITADMLSAQIQQAVGATPKQRLHPPDGALTLRQARMLLERQMIDDTMQQTNHNITKTAEKLGLTRRGLQRILQRHGKFFTDDKE
ncbi:MAG: Regulatory protein AtoC [bacterium]|nr:Regulatory protein AtoC [bacterium]